MPAQQSNSTETDARRHVLVVEDDTACGAAYASVLRKAGYKVSLAPDFRMALHILEAEAPLDLLLSDIVMPGGVNGLALSRMARLRRRDVKVLYVTGYDVPCAEMEALGPILRKPLMNERLLSEVERLLAA